MLIEHMKDIISSPYLQQVIGAAMQQILEAIIAANDSP